MMQVIARSELFDDTRLLIAAFGLRRTPAVKRSANPGLGYLAGTLRNDHDFRPVRGVQIYDRDHIGPLRTLFLGDNQHGGGALSQQLESDAHGRSFSSERAA